jgi:TolA-binding protein
MPPFPFAWTTLLALSAALHSGLDQRADELAGRVASLYADACRYLNQGSPALAALHLERFLQEFPHFSPWVPEVTYKLACAHLLQGQPDAAQKTLDQLVRKHPDSAWAQIALLTHYDDSKLLRLAQQRRKIALETGQAADYRAAAKLYRLHTTRFPNTQANKAELLYQLAHSFLQAGQGDEALAILRHLQETDKQGEWGRLAALRLGDGKAFKEGFADLINWHGEEALRVFLDLYDRYEDWLEGDDRVKGAFYCGLCLFGLRRTRDALTTWETLRRQHPASRWAAESAFWLAEGHFAQKDFARAQKGFREMAQQYPRSPRAALAQQWADAIDRLEPGWAEVEQVLAGLFRQLGKSEGGFALAVEIAAPELSGGYRCRIALQDLGRFYLSADYQGQGLLVASNREGSWYRSLCENVLVKARQPFEIPLPRGEVRFDPADDSRFDISFAFSSESGPDQAPRFTIPPEFASYAIAKLKGLYHLNVEVRKDAAGREQHVYHLQTPGWWTQPPTAWVIWVDADRKIREVRWTPSDNQGGQTVLAITGIAIGEHLDDDAFAVTVPPGVTVREVERLDALEILAQLMKWVGTLYEQTRRDTSRK